MELELKKKKINKSNLTWIAGLMSFIFSLISLSVINAGLLLKNVEVADFFVFRLPVIGLVLGVAGLISKGRSRLYSWWGIGLNIFTLIFIFLMFGLAWIVSGKP